MLLTPRAGHPTSFDPPAKRPDTRQKEPETGLFDSINPSSLKEMSGNSFLAGGQRGPACLLCGKKRSPSLLLLRTQEPDTRGHPTRQRDEPTLPRKDRAEASLDSINPSSFKEMSGKSLLLPLFGRGCSRFELPADLKQSARKRLQNHPQDGAGANTHGRTSSVRARLERVFLISMNPISSHGNVREEIR